MTKKGEILALHNVSVTYPNSDSPVLNSISMTIQPQEHIAIVGSNGAGKTTLLKKIFTLMGMNAAFIHQKLSLVPQLSVFHNIYMGTLDSHSTFYNLLNLITPRKKEIQHILNTVSPLGIGSILMKRVGELSGGQQQRTAIGRALYRNTAIYLADEPVSAIDPAYAEIILQCLTKPDTTLVAAMHNIDLTLTFFSRIIGIKNKTIFFDLPVKKVAESHLSALYS